jgi:DNA-binding response OmpR family regulator
MPVDRPAILIVEDEALVGLEIELAFREMGIAEVRWAPDLEKARQILNSETIDGAVLDVLLGDTEVFPLAEELARRGIAFVFHTGHAQAVDINRQWPASPVFRKPVAGAQVARGLLDMLPDTAPAQ